jgi:hypothetical protein
MFEVRRRRQDVVGIARGVGVKMLQHNGKQARTCKTSGDFSGRRRDRYRVTAIDNHGLDSRAEPLELPCSQMSQG